VLVTRDSLSTVLLPSIVCAGTGCQGVGARIEDLETSLSFTQIGTKAGRVFFEHFADTPRDNYALLRAVGSSTGVPKATCSCMRMRWFATLSPYFVKDEATVRVDGNANRPIANFPTQWSNNFCEAPFLGNRDPRLADLAIGTAAFGLYVCD
jgi:hypothetical protein